MPEPTVAAPSAPAPSPAPAPAPAAPSPAPAPAPAAPSSPFSKLDERARSVPAKKEPADTKTPEGTPPAEPKPGNAPEPEKRVAESPKWYREQISQKSADLEKATRRLQELESKVADYDKRGLDTKALTEQLEAREKAYEKAMAELSAAKYERSPEYKEKYDKPFSDAAEYAKQVVEQLRVELDDGSERPAKWDDFAAIYRLSPAQAEVAAVRMFGGSSAIVMRHLDKLRELEHNKRVALTQHEANAGEREKEARSKEIQHSEKINKAWNMTNQDLINANPEAFGEIPGDDEGNAIWKDSLAEVDKAYTGRNKLTPEEQLVYDAHIRLRSAAFPRDQRTIALLKAENDELKARLGDKTSSTPGRTRKTDSAAPAPAKDWKQEMRELNLITP